MRRRWTVAVVAMVVAFGLSGCKDKAPPADPKPTEQPAEPAETPEPDEPLPGAETATASASGKSDPLCVGPIDLAPPEKRTVGPWQVETQGYKVSFGAESDGKLVLGVVSDIKEDTGENLFNLGRYADWFQKKGVEAVFVSGDTGETDAAIERALAALAAPGWPVFALAGNRESRSAFADGLTAVQKTHPNVFNFNKRRLAQFPEASVLSLPGYHDPRFIHSETGCQYYKEDVDALLKLAKEVTGTKVLVAHGPPRGKTPQAIDAATEAGNVGDPNINRLLTEGGISFGLFGNIHEAGGKATDLTGTNIVQSGTAAASFYLNPGPADSIRWMMNDGTESTGMAAVVTIGKDGKASYEVYRAKALTSTEQAEAAKLAPPEEDFDLGMDEEDLGEETAGTPAPGAGGD